jgi:hypothetical protein
MEFSLIFISPKLTSAFSPHLLKFWTVVQLKVSVEGHFFRYFRIKVLVVTQTNGSHIVTNIYFENRHYQVR